VEWLFLVFSLVDRPILQPLLQVTCAGHLQGWVLGYGPTDW